MNDRVIEQLTFAAWSAMNNSDKQVLYEQSSQFKPLH